MNSEVTDLIEALRGGAMSLDDVAQRFRERSWPRRRTLNLRRTSNWPLPLNRIPNRSAGILR